MNLGIRIKPCEAGNYCRIDGFKGLSAEIKEVIMLNVTDFDWAKPCKASDDQINNAIVELDCGEEYGDSMSGEVANQILTDDEDDSLDLLNGYKHASDHDKSVMDATLIWLCGYSLGSILAKMENDDEE